MANSKPAKWATSGRDLFLDLGAGGRGLRVAIEDGIRGAIRSGRLIPGTRLPATRALARDLGVSRGTVLQAYDQLVAEGWLRGRRGSSTVVIAEAEAHRQSTAIREPPPVRWRYDLRPGRPDASSFPRAEWLRAVRRALATAPNAAFGYDSPQGQLPLRVRAGGLPEPGPRSSRLAGGRGGHRRLHPGPGPGGSEPGCNRRPRGRDGGAEHAPAPLDRPGGGSRDHPHRSRRRWHACGRARGLAGVGGAVLTPNRQHPTGATLSPSRRSRLAGLGPRGGSPDRRG